MRGTLFEHSLTEVPMDCDDVPTDFFRIVNGWDSSKAAKVVKNKSSRSSMSNQVTNCSARGDQSLSVITLLPRAAWELCESSEVRQLLASLVKRASPTVLRFLRAASLTRLRRNSNSTLSKARLKNEDGRTLRANSKMSRANACWCYAILGFRVEGPLLVPR